MFCRISIANSENTIPGSSKLLYVLNVDSLDSLDWIGVHLQMAMKIIYVGESLEC